MGKNSNSIEVKWAVIQAKLEGKMTTKQIIEQYEIKINSQVETLMRRYKSGETYRFEQPIGKQYKYGYGPKSASKEERLGQQIKHLKADNEILKKF